MTSSSSSLARAHAAPGNSPLGLPMDGSTSLTLDALRLLAAAVVVVFHATGLWATAYPALHNGLGKASHAAVVAFFVISGYVIAYTTARRETGFQAYVVARLSRLYSGLLPALLLTALVEAVVVATNPAVAARYVHAHSWARYGLTAVFGSELGWWSAAPPINSPLWSLSYEFWYYLLFGLWTYCRAGLRGWWLGLAAVVAGPKILLLLPIWLFGVAACRCRRPALGAARAWPLVAGLLALAALAVAWLPAWPAAVGDPPLFMSSQFLTDWVVGLLVAGAIWLLPAGPPAGSRPGVKYLRRVADLSFSLYVLHFPLLVLWRVLFAWRANDLGQLGQAIGLASLGAGIIGWWLEGHRGTWIRFFNWIMGVFITRARAAKASPANPE